MMSFAGITSADASRQLYSGSRNGYNYVGRGEITGYIGKASFQATENPKLPHNPPSDCRSEAWVLVYDNSGYVGAANSRGTTSAYATYKSNNRINKRGCSFSFMGQKSSTYVLYNN